ncbi:hypothetical protein B0H14DRAFT_2569178 [Mycena olivaceomarginata]|nr:hypothetical protein B0H14DRAFT_2569178 [Mycena olivaceomarginata]
MSSGSGKLGTSSESSRKTGLMGRVLGRQGYVILKPHFFLGGVGDLFVALEQRFKLSPISNRYVVQIGAPLISITSHLEPSPALGLGSLEGDEKARTALAARGKWLGPESNDSIPASSYEMSSNWEWEWLESSAARMNKYQNSKADTDSSLRELCLTVRACNSIPRQKIQRKTTSGGHHRQKATDQTLDFPTLFVSNLPVSDTFIKFGITNKSVVKRRDKGGKAVGVLIRA